MSDKNEDNLSLTPILDTSKLVIPPALLTNNNASSSTIDINPAVIISKSQDASANKKQQKSRPAFVNKVWTMVNDPADQELISWTANGESFIVKNREQFVIKVLPKYFKHSNFASFVRQLNMYGWHKVHDVNSGSIHSQSDENWSFINPSFKKGREDLLENIVRNKPGDDNPNSQSSQGIDKLDVNLLINELNVLKNNQLKITQELSRVRQDNELLWTELFQTREKNTIQNEKIERILQFLASVYGNRVKQLDDSFMNYMQPQLDSTQFNENQQIQQYHPPIRAQQISSNQPTTTNSNINNLTEFKPRLMLKQHRHVSNSTQISPNSSTVQTPKVNEESPVQEIIRTPVINSYDDVSYKPYEEILPSNTTSVPETPSDLILQQAIELPNDTTSTRPQLVRRNTSVSEINKTIEQQGQFIDDIISKLSQQQNNLDTESEVGTGNFDLNEFLDQDLILENSKNNTEQLSNTNNSNIETNDSDEQFNDTPTANYSEFAEDCPTNDEFKEPLQNLPPQRQYNNQYIVSSPSLKRGAIQEIDDNDDDEFQVVDPNESIDTSNGKKHGLEERRTRGSKKRKSDG